MTGPNVIAVLYGKKRSGSLTEEGPDNIETWEGLDHRLVLKHHCSPGPQVHWQLMRFLLPFLGTSEDQFVRKGRSISQISHSWHVLVLECKLIVAQGREGKWIAAFGCFLGNGDGNRSLASDSECPLLVSFRQCYNIARSNKSQARQLARWPDTTCTHTHWSINITQSHQTYELHQLIKTMLPFNASLNASPKRMLPLELLPKQLSQRGEGRKVGDREGGLKITVGRGLANDFPPQCSTVKL